MLCCRGGQWFASLSRAECGCVVSWLWVEPYAVRGYGESGGAWQLVSSCVGCRRKFSAGSGCACRVPVVFAARFPAPACPPCGV